MLTFTNQAALSYRNRVRYSNLTTGQIADTLTVAKEALTGTYGPGGDVTYVVRLANNGTAPLTDLTLTDDLGGYAFGGGTVYPLSYVADSRAHRGGRPASGRVRRHRARRRERHGGL